MATDSYKLGPGVLTLGAGPLDVSAQVTKCELVPSESVETVPAIDTLDGGQIPEEETASITWVMNATFVQDGLTIGGLTAYLLGQAGANIAFKFIPANALNRKWTGTLRAMPIKSGGDVKTRNTSDATFKVIGTPVLANTP